ncbi:hypothetical protein IP70_06060 [alpha proteobacterium AAP38]|nr:hypothetical protein IP70_06060 [alpha proteobacterium AAP38]
MNTKHLLATTTALALLAGPAIAQDSGLLEEIVVTGSRIARPAEQSPVPVTALGEAELSARGITSISDALSRLPALQNTRSSDQLSSASPVPTANLRGLGAARTLVLVNGRRHVAGIAGEASVDISTIPSALVERVDVLTGGASAVYGSDAVTGVVNFVLKKDFEGQDITAQYGLSEKGDADRRYVAATIGRNFDDGKGNITLSLSSVDQKPLGFGDRKWSRGNGIADDTANPDLFLQETDLTPALRAAGVTAGTRILSLSTANQAIAGQTLIARATNAKARAFGTNQRFGLSSIYGIIGFDPRGTGFPVSGTNSRAPNIDLDNNGTRDCVQNYPGRRGYGCLVIDPATGKLRPFQDGILANNDQFGGDGTPDYLDRATLVGDLSTQTANLNARYEVNPYFKPFVEAKYVRNTSRQVESVRTFDDSIRIKLDNPFIPQQLRDIANAQIAAEPALASTYQFIITRDHADVVDPVVRNTRDTYRGVLGFEGEFDNGWAYEASYNYGRTDATDKRPTRLNDRFFAAIDAVRAPNGQIVCRSDLNPTSIPSVSDFPVFSWSGYNTFKAGDGSCKPLNLFGLGAPSEAAQDFVTYDNPVKSTIKQQVWNASITGDLGETLSLPGGPIGFAAGLEHRKEDSRFEVTEWERLNYTDRGGRQNVVGGFDVTEGFVELNAPLLADLPGVELLSLDGAYRYGDYSTVGGVNTWKVGGVYAPVKDIRARGGYSRTIRAPNIQELFAPRSSTLFSVVDPCDAGQIGTGPSPANRRANCAADGIPNGWLDTRTARVPGFTGGNPDLDPETSTSYTAGVVLTPSFLPRFSLAVDYWNIKIEDAISQVTGQNILNACYDAPSRDNPFCSQVGRNRTSTSPTFLAVNSLNQTTINFARFEASGIDFDLVYPVDLEEIGLGENGRVTLGLTGTWNEKNRTFQTPSNAAAANNALGERLFPEWNLNPSVSWSDDVWSVAWYGFYQSRQTLTGVETETASTFVQAYAPAAWVHDATVSYQVTEEVRVTAGVNNLTNKGQFYGDIGRPASAIGRSYYLRTRLVF